MEMSIIIHHGCTRYLLIYILQAEASTYKYGSNSAWQHSRIINNGTMLQADVCKVYHNIAYVIIDFRFPSPNPPRLVDNLCTSGKGIHIKNR